MARSLVDLLWGFAASIALICLSATRSLGQSVERDSASAIQAALMAQQASGALSLARRYTEGHPRDPNGWVLLGRAYLISDLPHARVAAIGAFSRAMDLAPAQAETWYWLARAGLALGGSDGEWYVATGSERALSLDPTYPGAWNLWLGVFRDADARERMLGILSAHRDVPEVRARIARILIESERYDEANTELDALVALEPEDPEWLALRAQSAFESGDSAAGLTYYDRAIAHADHDTAAYLWQQIIGIASPDEIRAWQAGVAPQERAAFFRNFWARRDPDLFARRNARIQEHFLRLRVARREFPLKFPLSDYETKPRARTVSAMPTYGEALFYARCEAQQVPGGPTRAEDRARMPLSGAYFPLYPTSVGGQWANPVLPPGALDIDPSDFLRIGPAIAPAFAGTIRDVDTSAAAIGYNLRTSLDDRGITYLRFGAPKHRLIGADNTGDPFCAVHSDLERWTYDDIGTVRFFRPEAISLGAMTDGGPMTGDLVFRPMGNRQFEAMAASLTQDETSIPAPLSFGVWVAQFASGTAGSTDVAVISTRGRLTAQLVGGADAPQPRTETHPGLVEVPTAPGSFLLMAHVVEGDALGRQSLPLLVRALGRQTGISDLLMAPAWSDTTTTRAGMFTHLQRDLTFASSSTLRSYVEIYGLPPDADNRVHYWASYQMYRTNDVGRAARRRTLPGAVVLGFERSRPAAERVLESLDITLGRLEPGRYLLRLEIRATEAGEPIGRAQLGFQIRPETAP